MANKKKKKIVVMWKIVGTPKVSVLYIYIDDGLVYPFFFFLFSFFFSLLGIVIS